MPADPESFALFFTSKIPDVLGTLFKIYEVATIRRLKDVATGALDIAEELLADVNRIAIEIAGMADGLIVRKMLETQSRNRPFTGNMETHVVSAPGPLGSVRVALIAELDKIINPRGYGPFWRAQEYGTGSHEVASQVGRAIVGVFEPSGEAPDNAQQGLGVGTDAAFESGTGPDAGKGVISVELPGRHFLRDGSTEAGERFVEAMEGAAMKAVARIRGLNEHVAAASVDVRYTRVLRA